jgi:nitrous oxide reductase accessory protein NosL
MMQFKNIFFIITIVSFLFLGCEKKINKNLHEVHWDRDMCELCKMVVSERKYAVQAVNIKSGRSFMFDDLGCAVLWFEENKLPLTDINIFISDVKSGEFIDAKKAWYDTNSRTPMDYGFGAYKHKDKSKKFIDFEEARLKILRGETMQNPRIKKGQL